MSKKVKLLKAFKNRLEKGKICPKGIAWAKRTFDKYPSAYANLAASKYCKDPKYGKNKKVNKSSLYSEYIEPMQKSEKLPHFMKFMGDHSKAQETASWADDNLKHRNLAEFAMRHAKTKPEGLNDEEKTQIKHFNDSLHMPEVQKAAGSLNKKHDYNTGIGILKDAESKYAQRHKENAPKLIPHEGEKILDLGDGVGVYNLGKQKCENEAVGMGHCATPHKGGDLWSIRKDHGNGQAQPLVTLSHEEGYLGEIKGKANAKPSTKYHPYIAKLMASDLIKGFVGGGYAPESNFEFSDMKDSLREKLLNYKPSLTNAVYKEQLPDGFHGNYSHTPEIKSIFNSEDPNVFDLQDQILNAHGPDSKLCLDLASNSSTPRHILEKLFNSHELDSKVYHHLARNPNTPHYIMEKLFNSHEPDSYVHGHLAINSNAPAHILEKLFNSHESDSAVHHSLARNSNTPHHIIEKLFNSHGPDSWTFRELSNNPNTPARVLEKIYDKSIIHAPKNNTLLAGNPNTPHHILEKIYNKSRPGSNDRQNLARNPNTPHHILEALHDINEPNTVHWGLARNPNTPHHILEKIYNSHEPGSDMHRLLAGNPNLPEQLKPKVRPLMNTNIQKIIAMMNNEDDPRAAEMAHDELLTRRKEKYDKILSSEGDINHIKHLAESHDENIAKRAREELKRREKDMNKSLRKSVLFKGELQRWLDQKWKRIDSSGKIAGDCGTSKNTKNPDRCLPESKARSLSQGERAATAKKKKQSGKKGKQFVANTKKAKVSLKKADETKIKIMPHPKDVIDVDNEIIQNMKERLAGKEQMPSKLLKLRQEVKMKKADDDGEIRTIDYSKFNKPKKTQSSTLDYSKFNKPKEQGPTIDYSKFNKPEKSKSPTLDYSKFNKPKKSGSNLDMPIGAQKRSHSDINIEQEQKKAVDAWNNYVRQRHLKKMEKAKDSEISVDKSKWKPILD